MELKPQIISVLLMLMFQVSLQDNCTVERQSDPVTIRCVEKDAVLNIEIDRKTFISIRCSGPVRDVSEMMPILNETFVDQSYGWFSITECPFPRNFTNLGTKVKNLRNFSYSRGLPLQVTSDLFNGAEDLIALTLASSSIQDIETDAFSNLFQLYNLNLSGNNISKIYSEMFQNNSELRTLDINENSAKLEVLSGCFTELLELISVQLKGCKEVILNDNLFRNDSKLDLFDISGSNLVSFNR
jgi:BspA type Leucine rich repeat region (6 copies)